jgi:hypothetical protein
VPVVELEPLWQRPIALCAPFSWPSWPQLRPRPRRWQRVPSPSLSLSRHRRDSKKRGRPGARQSPDARLRSLLRTSSACRHYSVSRQGPEVAFASTFVQARPLVVCSDGEGAQHELLDVALIQAIRKVADFARPLDAESTMERGRASWPTSFSAKIGIPIRTRAQRTAGSRRRASRPARRRSTAPARIPHRRVGHLGAVDAPSVPAASVGCPSAEACSAQN